MHPVDRRHRILEQVAEKQTIHIGELARDLGVSEMTIRRDISRLERDGFLRRTYGGATAHLTRSMELLFNARALENAPAKRLIGMRAAQLELVEEARTIFVGIGTTAEQFARSLSPREERTVITSSLAIASLLGTRRGRVVVLGGTILPDELACVGPAAAATVRRYHADVTVIGAAGLSASRGITELDDEAAEIQRQLIDRGDHLIVLADGSKIGEATMASVTSATRVNMLVTDSSAPAEELALLEALGMETVVVAREDGKKQSEAKEERRRS